MPAGWIECFLGRIRVTTLSPTRRMMYNNSWDRLYWIQWVNRGQTNFSFSRRKLWYQSFSYLLPEVGIQLQAIQGWTTDRDIKLKHINQGGQKRLGSWRSFRQRSTQRWNQTYRQATVEDQSLSAVQIYVWVEKRWLCLSSVGEDILGVFLTGKRISFRVPTIFRKTYNGLWLTPGWNANIIEGRAKQECYPRLPSIDTAYLISIIDENRY